jgi:hypothetical protein
MKDKLKAVIEEVWRRKFGHASLSTELWNVINALKTDLFKEIDALEDEDAPKVGKAVTAADEAAAREAQKAYSAETASASARETLNRIPEE